MVELALSAIVATAEFGSAAGAVVVVAVVSVVAVVVVVVFTAAVPPLVVPALPPPPPHDANARQSINAARFGIDFINCTLP